MADLFLAGTDSLDRENTIGEQLSAGRPGRIHWQIDGACTDIGPNNLQAGSFGLELFSWPRGHVETGASSASVAHTELPVERRGSGHCLG